MPTQKSAELVGWQGALAVDARLAESRPVVRGEACWPVLHSRMGERRCAVDREGEVVHIAEPPVLPRLEGLDDRVLL